MKKFFIIIALIAIVFLNSNAQNSAKMTIHKTDNSSVIYNLSEIDSITFTPCQSEKKSLPLSGINWICYQGTFTGKFFKNPAPGVFESVSEGLKITAMDYREGAIITPIPLNNYKIMGKTLFFKWKANGGGDFMGVGPSIFTDTIIWTAPSNSLINLTTNYSSAGSFVITDDEWYYTRIIVGTTTWTLTTSTGNYDNLGGSVIQTNTDTFDNKYKYFYWGIWDCYASTAAYAILGEFKIE